MSAIEVEGTVVCSACDRPLGDDRVTCAACLAPQHEACFDARGACVRCGDARLLRRPRDVAAWKTAADREEALAAPSPLLAKVRRGATVALAVVGGAIALAFALLVAVVAGLFFLVARLFGARTSTSSFYVSFPSRRDDPLP